MLAGLALLIGIGQTGLAHAGVVVYRSGCGSSNDPRRVVIVSLRTSAVDCAFPDISYSAAAVSDGHGGWFVVGYIGRVGVEHLLADGRPDRGWRPPAEPPHEGDFGAVDLIGGTLYVGGAYKVDALSAQTGALLWSTPTPGDVQGIPTGVVALTGNRHAVYIAGGFTSVDGKPIRAVAALNPVNGQPLAWRSPVFGQPVWYPAHSLNVNALTLYGGQLFIGGNFSRVDGHPRNTIAALDATTGALRPWVVHLRSGKQPLETMFTPTSLLATNGKVLIGEGENDRPDGGIANARTGLLESYWPEEFSWASWFAVSGGIVYAGGNTTSGAIDDVGQEINDLGAYSLSGRTPIPWVPAISPIESGEGFAISDGRMLLIGIFS